MQLSYRATLFKCIAGQSNNERNGRNVARDVRNGGPGGLAG